VGEQRGWDRILQSITAPVVLFGLVTLVVGGTTVAVVGFSDLSPGKMLVVLGAGVLFLVILLVVFLLTWFKPQNLIYSEAGHLEESAMAWGVTDNPVARDIIERRRQYRIQGNTPEAGSGGSTHDLPGRL
jgi:hypothetical protein